MSFNHQFRYKCSVNDPDARRGGQTIRTGYLANSGKALFVVQIAERDATLPAVEAAFAGLWGLALGFGGPQ